jgi:4-hydroxy-3-polyprenylbenzoate decarboxylase
MAMTLDPFFLPGVSDKVSSFSSSELSQAAEMGAHIVPPIPAFYHHPKTIDDIINQSVGKVLDYMGIEHDLFKRWDNSELEKLETLSETPGKKNGSKVIAMK